ncbi:MAG: AI-2E family transporter [Pseudonocardiaceae bacterium]
MSESPYRDATTAVPYSLRVAAAVSWRVLAVTGLFIVVGHLVIWLRVVVIPVAVALLLTALLGPVVNWMTRRVPRALATTIVMFSGLALIGGMLAFVVQAFVDGFPELRTQVGEGLQEIRSWLERPHFGLPPVNVENLFDSVGRSISSSSITSGAVTTAVTVGEILTGIVLALFVLSYFLYGGRSMWLFIVRLVPVPVRDRFDVAGLSAYASLVGFVRATVLVAIADAIGIGIGLFVVGAPLVVPLMALVFLASFVPVVGAVVSGVAAVLVVLVANGPVEALIVLGVVIGVQQLEGNVLQPLLLGRAVKLNGVAVVLAVAVGALTAGIIGTLLAVPLLAVFNAGIRSLAGVEETEQIRPKLRRKASVVPVADTPLDPDPDPPPGVDVRPVDP